VILGHYGDLAFQSNPFADATRFKVVYRSDYTNIKEMT